MKIKHALAFLIIMIIGLQSTNSYSQSTEIHQKFIVQDARFNDIDVSQQWIAGGAYLAIYTIEGSKEIYFASVNPGQKSNSSGRIFHLTHFEGDEDDVTYENRTFNFQWSYQNSYDTKKGTAKVKIIQVKKNGSVGFTCYIVSENLDQIVFKGYMED